MSDCTSSVCLCSFSLSLYCSRFLFSLKEREGGREGEREREREGEREGREREMGERGREKEGGRERGRERIIFILRMTVLGRSLIFQPGEREREDGRGRRRGEGGGEGGRERKGDEFSSDVEGMI